MPSISALIIDDELDSRSTLRSYVGRYCPQVEVVRECANIIEASYETRQTKKYSI